MLDCYEEERPAQRVVPYLSHGTFATLKIWLRGRDLNPRPLGYEPNLINLLGNASDHSKPFS
jgi:hypothetical protein